MDQIATFVFYSKANGIQSRLAFSEEFKHCNVATYDGQDWIMLDFDSTGLLTRRIKAPNAPALLRNLRSLQIISAVICVEVTQRHKFMWSPWWVRSCNEICRYASGVDIGFTFNPVHLYGKLLKYNDRRNYQILSHWRRLDGILRGRQ